MPTEQELRKLLDRYTSGNCSSEEIKLLEIWFNQIGKNQQVAYLSEGDRHRMLHAFRQNPRFNKGRYHIGTRFPIWKSVSAAAAIAGILLLSGLWLNNRMGKGNQQAVHYVQIRTGKGEVRRVMLPDSSVVWINARTALAYHPDFKNNRSLRLDGEAVFQVAHDQAHPFRVQTADSVETTVLGTQFNIRSYAQLSETQVTVLEGKVKVGKISEKVQGILLRSDVMRFNRLTKKFVKTLENPEATASWRTGQWELRGNGLEALALLLYNQYGITLEHSTKSLEKLVINANFNHQQTAEEIVSTFCTLAGCRYKWKDGNNVELY